MSQDLYQAFMVIINFAALVVAIIALIKKQQLKKAIQWLGRLLSNLKNYERAVSSPGCQLSLSMLIIPQKMEKTNLR
ncbi:putative holin-like toxin [uncultured Dialister sp.]|uniref:putative holin-like toxin n=1 Tax=uncultured Dialister sp. TaxID=278064 RepID=UPI0025D8119E|nr:putative holin-like toxin [uncultured Dialister sp.]